MEKPARYIRWDLHIGFGNSISKGLIWLQKIECSISVNPSEGKVIQRYSLLAQNESSAPWMLSSASVSGRESTGYLKPRDIWFVSAILLCFWNHDFIMIGSRQLDIKEDKFQLILLGSEPGSRQLKMKGTTPSGPWNKLFHWTSTIWKEKISHPHTILFIQVVTH